LGSPQAQASTTNSNLVGPFSSYESCKATQNSYISSWTKIAVPCYIATTPVCGYYFVYNSI